MDKKPKRDLGIFGSFLVPQSWFSHFYLVGVVCNCWVLYALAGCDSQDRSDLVSLVCAFMLNIHLVRRLMENVFVLKYTEDAKMHIMAYLFGLRWVVEVRNPRG